MHDFLRQLGAELGRALFWVALALLVGVTAALGRPRRRFVATEYPPPLGVRIVVWGSLGFWALMIAAAADVGMNWLAAAFLLGPAYTLWRWPETIAIDELRITRSAWCHRDVTILWHEVDSIRLGAHGDSLIVRGRNGESIGVSRSQVGADQLIAEISRRSGLECPAFTAAGV